MTRRSADAAELPAFELLEEAVGLLRRAPLSAWLAYLAGVLPFALALPAFAAEMSRGAFAAARVSPLALLLALLFAAMKSAQSSFCAALDRLLREEAAPRARLLSTAALQTAFHGWALFLLPLAALSVLPAGWAFALAQNVTVLGRRERRGLRDLLRRANAQAALWPRQNHAALAVLGAFSLAVLGNVALALLAVPSLARVLTGSENAFTRSGLHAINTTFLSVTLVLAWLALDPLVKALYTLRCFHGESLATGEDLLVPLRRLRARRVAAALLLALLALLPLGGAARAETPAAPSRVSPPALDRAIRDVLERPEYAWRKGEELPPVSEGPFGKLLDALRRGSSRAFRAVAGWARAVWRFLKGLLAPTHTPQPGTAGGGTLGAFLGSRALLFGALALVLALGAILVLRTRRRRARGEAVAAEPVAAPAPDPLLPTTTADQREPEEWLVLGRELLGKGDLRRALRALYLGALGTLARAELIRLKAAKSNGEYARELSRRAADRAELLAAFGALVTEFERAWYGRHEVTREALARVERELERVRTHAA